MRRERSDGDEDDATPTPGSEYGSVDYILKLNSNQAVDPRLDPNFSNLYVRKRKSTSPNVMVHSRKQRKNIREQQRRKELADRFDVLSKLCFGSCSSRIDKSQILDRAIVIIEHVQKIVDHPLDNAPLPRELDPAEAHRVKAENCSLRMQLFNIMRVTQENPDSPSASGMVEMDENAEALHPAAATTAVAAGHGAASAKYAVPVPAAVVPFQKTSPDNKAAGHGHSHSHSNKASVVQSKADQNAAAIGLQTLAQTLLDHAERDMREDDEDDKEEE